MPLVVLMLILYYFPNHKLVVKKLAEMYKIFKESLLISSMVQTGYLKNICFAMYSSCFNREYMYLLFREYLIQVWGF